MEIKRIYNDPVDENDIANKRYVDKNVKAVVDKTIADTVDSIATGKTPLDNLVVGNITGKNLFDEQWGTLGKRYTNSTSVKFATTNASGQIGIANPIKLDKSKSYLIISTNSNYNTNGVYFYDANGIYLSHVYINYRAVPIPSDAYYMTFNLTGVTDIADLANYKWQIEYIDSETGTSTPYSKKKKYGYNSQESMGEIIVDDITCKNLLDSDKPNQKTGTVTWSGVGKSHTLTNTAATECVIWYIPIKAGEKYVFSYKQRNSGSLYLQIKERSAMNITNSSLLKTIVSNGAATAYTFVVENDGYLQISFSCSSPISDVLIEELQLEKGTVATEYAPHKSLGYTSGSNKNGSWVKYDDGRMECWNTHTFNNVSCTTQAGSTGYYRSDDYLLFPNFPQEFKSLETVVTSYAGSTGWHGMFVLNAEPHNNVRHGRFYLLITWSTTVPDPKVSYHAIGRWK